MMVGPGSISGQRPTVGSRSRQIEWVDHRLEQWGDWQRRIRHPGPRRPGSQLGSIYKARMKELGIWDEPKQVRVIQSAPEWLMEEIDKAIKQLTKPRLIDVALLHYYRDWSIPRVSAHIHRTTRMVDYYIVQLHHALEPNLTFEFRDIC